MGDYEQYYKEAVDNAAQYNARMELERKMRLPFLDSQTGVVQNSCGLWVTRIQRGPGVDQGQVYTYPGRRWRKKRRPPPDPEVPAPPETLEPPVVEGTSNVVEPPPGAPILPPDNPVGSEKDMDDFQDFDSISDIPDAGEIEDDEESDEDYYYDSRKRNRSRSKGASGGGGGSKKKKENEMPILTAEDKERPFLCNFCGRRYKNRPGLNNHISHVHHAEVSPEEPSQPSPLEPAAEPGGKSSYCDFCLGDVSENKKTLHPEELISCSDCGRSAHPSCLQFTELMTANVKKYCWQCIECKSCGLCGTSDNDDQLLFCDDCDRGYHMYCLKPPLSSPPEGSWICYLCEKDAKDREKSNQEK